MNKKGRGPGKANRKLKAVRAASLAMNGATNSEIAEELGMCRNAVSRLLNSKETEEIIKAAESRVTRMVDKACGVVDKAMDDVQSTLDMTNGLKAALAVLTSLGVLKKKVDVSHSFPKPTVIKRMDGSEVVLGTTADQKDDND